MSVQKAIFPGLLFGICCIIGLTSLLAINSPKKGGITQTGSAAASAKNENSASGSANAANSQDCSISPQYPESVRKWCGMIERYAHENQIDPNVISAVMLQESGGNPDAYSKSGAVGLLQVMPRDGLASAFMCPAGPCFSNRPSMDQLYDPEYNIQYGTKMLSDLIQHYGDLREALKAYGPHDVGYYYADIVLRILYSHQ